MFWTSGGANRGGNPYDCNMTCILLSCLPAFGVGGEEVYFYTDEFLKSIIEQILQEYKLFPYSIERVK